MRHSVVFYELNTKYITSCQNTTKLLYCGVQYVTRLHVSALLGHLQVVYARLESHQGTLLSSPAYTTWRLTKKPKHVVVLYIV